MASPRRRTARAAERPSAPASPPAPAPLAPDPARPRPWFERTPLGAVVVLLAVLLASWPALGNGFSGDDRPIIELNGAVRSPAGPLAAFGAPYWPPETGQGLYRPVTITGFALQWRIGAGAAWVFHLGSLLLKGAAAVALLVILRRLLPPVAALGGALLFAVHPVHNEAVGTAVGQAELHMTLAALLAAVCYLRAAERGRVDWLDGAGVAGAAAYGLLAKEQGLLLPLTLLALEYWGLGAPHRSSRGERLRLLLVPAVVVLLAIWLWRARVVAGLGVGSLAWPWRGLGSGDRALVMLGLVPEIGRLLVWPFRLRTEYNPPAIDVSAAFGVAQAAGLLMLGAGAWAIWRASRQVPVAALGIAWAAIAFAPVSNLLVPTGVVLAERNLLQPSVGVVLAFVAGGTWWLQRRTGPRWLPGAGAGMVCTLIVAFGWRTATRLPVWRDDETVIAQMLRDRPVSYFGWFNEGVRLEAGGREAEALAAFETARRLWDGDGRMLERMASMHLRAGRPAEAVPLLARSLEIDARRPPTRKVLFQTLQALGRADEARAVALRGIEVGDPGFAPATPRPIRPFSGGGAP